MTRFLATAALLAASCASAACPWDGTEIDPPADAEPVLAAWAARYGKLSQLCYDVPQTYEYAGTEYCVARVNGCLVDWTGDAEICRAILLRPKFIGNACTYTHELTHWLLFCTGERLDGDPEHSHEAWHKGGFIETRCKAVGA